MADDKMTLKEKLMHIQIELKAPKNLKNSFGNYMYRSAEDILKALKPFEKKYKVTTTICDEMVGIFDRVYVKAVVSLKDIESDDEIYSVGWAREAASKKGADDSQITGMASSYARKYALSGMFLLDDTKDADSDEPDFSEYDKLAPRKALAQLAEDYQLDLNSICQICGITNASGDEVFKEAIEYAKGLIAG